MIIFLVADPAGASSCVDILKSPSSGEVFADQSDNVHHLTDDEHLDTHASSGNIYHMNPSKFGVLLVLFSFSCCMTRIFYSNFLRSWSCTRIVL